MYKRLSSVTCECGALIVSDEFVPDSRGRAPTANGGYKSCLRRCEDCGIGFSNNKNASGVIQVLRDPFRGLPKFIGEGCERALSECLNTSHRQKKKHDFHSLNSEDHVTWTLMRFLQNGRLLGQAFGHPDVEPILLMWGVPVPNDCSEGWAIREKIIRISNAVHERERQRSEPDVVLDFRGAGIVIIEAKLRSTNDWKEATYEHWPKYQHRAAFGDWDGAVATGYYQLVRNWRIGLSLACGRPLTLINLASAFTADEIKKLERLRLCFRTSRRRCFVLRMWSDVMRGVVTPVWLSEYFRQREVLVDAAPG
jgi:hypothetical protein